MDASCGLRSSFRPGRRARLNLVHEEHSIGRTTSSSRMLRESNSADGSQYEASLNAACEPTSAHESRSARPRWPPGHQATHDLEVARQLDSKDSIKAIGTASQRIAKALAAAPKEPASKLHAELLKAARDSLSMDQLAERAVNLLKASNGWRRLGDEVYSETRRELAWALLASSEESGSSRGGRTISPRRNRCTRRFGRADTLHDLITGSRTRYSKRPNSSSQTTVQ